MPGAFIKSFMVLYFNVFMHVFDAFYKGENMFLCFLFANQCF